MELATLAEFRYVPKWRRNRLAPEGSRASVLLRPLCGIDVLMELSDEDVRKWRDDRLRPLANLHPYLEPRVPHIAVNVLRAMRLIDEHSGDWRGWRHRGEPVTDGMVVLLMGFPALGQGNVMEPCPACGATGSVEKILPRPRDDGRETEACPACRGSGRVDSGVPHSLLVELNDAIQESSLLSEDDLKNWTALSDGTASTTATSATGAGEGASRTVAATPAAT